MKVLLTNKIVKLLKRKLRKASKREIGGLLMDEYVSEGVFRIVDMSVQRSGGRPQLDDGSD